MNIFINLQEPQRIIYRVPLDYYHISGPGRRHPTVHHLLRGPGAGQAGARRHDRHHRHPGHLARVLFHDRTHRLG